MNPAAELLNVHDYERVARERLPATTWHYYSGGAHDEVTLRANRDALDRLALRPRVLVGVSVRSTRARVLGADLAMPVLVAPTAFQRLACDDGERATARAAAAADTAMILSTLSTTPVEDVVREAGAAPVWFQLYVYRDREQTTALVRRAEDAGCRALVVTVDAPLLGRRERDVRGGFHLPEHLHAENLTGGRFRDLPRAGGNSSLAVYFESLIDASLTWRDVEWLRRTTPLPIVLKGILRGDDAARAADAGAAGVVVSNHGGRQLDGAVASIDALPEVAESVAGRAEVFFDGGARRGGDVIKALALGARAVLLGRPILYGLAVDGADGAARVLSILREELDHAMALCGAPDVASITRDLVR